MRCFLVFSLSFLISTINLYSQTELSDSLRQAFVSETDPLKKADFYYQWAYRLLEEKPETGLLTADTLEQLAKKAKSKFDLSRTEYLRGYAYTLLGKFEEALPHHRNELKLAMQTEELELQGKALSSLGNCYHNLLQNDSAIYYLLESAKVKEQLGNKKDLASVYANIGNVFSDEQAPDKAIEYLEKALAIRLSLPEGEKGAIVTYNNISIAYNGKGDFDKAIEYAQKGYDLANESGNKFLAGVLAGSLAHLWLEKNDPDKSIELAEKSISLLTELNRRSNLVYPYATLAEAWWRKGDFNRSLEVNRQGYAIMEELKLKEPLEVYYENFANAFEGTGDYKQSLFWFKKFMVLDDSLFTKEKLEAIAGVEAKFETKKKEAQLAKQQVQIEREAFQKKIILFGSVVAILALAGLFYFLRNKQRVKQKQAELAAQNAELTAQLKHAEAQKLRELDAIKSTFFANISHEFRTPLTLIISPVEQMINGTFKGDFGKYYQIIHRNAKRLLHLVNQLLDMSKLESGKLKLEASEGHLDQFVKAIAGSFESLAFRQLIDLKIVVPPDEVLCFFDRDKVEKILVNLISNAFKFTGEGGTIKIELLPFSENDQSNEVCTIIISDTGIGIPAEQLPQLFDRFGSSRFSEVQSGSGIGLALTRELVLLHGGDIQVESKEGEGTTFTFTLGVNRSFFKNDEIIQSKPVPAANSNEVFSDQVSRLSRDAIQPAFSSIYSSANQPVLLIAEDNPDVRTYIVDNLSDEYQIIEAENGKLAMDKALEHIPDLVISDVMMPEMDGTEFCKLLKSNEKTSHIPLIMLTARAEQSDKLAGLQTGADDYLVKPFDVRELQVRVANLTEQRRRLKEHFRKSLSAFATSPVEAESMDAVFLRRIRETVEANLEDETFSVVELGRLMGMSRSQLHRKLTALTDYSPNEVIRNMRLERAKQLLEKNTGTVSEVSYLCGFNSPAYFIKCFKDYFGVTPGEIT